MWMGHFKAEIKSCAKKNSDKFSYCSCHVAFIHFSILLYPMLADVSCICITFWLDDSSGLWLVHSVTFSLVFSGTICAAVGWWNQCCDWLPCSLDNVTCAISLSVAEQYESFLKFNHDQLQRRFGHCEMSCKYFDFRRMYVTRVDEFCSDFVPLRFDALSGFQLILLSAP
jgi:hypothetical protein